MEPSSKQDSAGEDLHDLRDAGVQVVKKLVEAGFIAYFAGGCVRDRLMGHEPTDYDVATNATPQDVANIFPKVQTVGESFGVMLVRVRGHVIQVATFRTEGVYSDGRHPDTVTFSDAEHDASRRDFTINGLFENPLTGEVIDYVGGRADLEKRVIRAIGDPHARLREDRLRMLRAVRFAARFGFSIDPETADAIRSGADQLQGVSRERIGQEVERMLSDQNRGVAAWEMQSLGLDAQVLQEPSKRVPLPRLSNLPDDVTYPTAVAAWLLDRHEQAHDQWQQIASRLSTALMHSNEHRIAIEDTLRAYFTLTSSWTRLGVAEQKRLVAHRGFSEALLLLQANDREAFLEVRRRVTELSRTGIAPAALIDGEDLISLGLRPGPVFSRILNAVYDAQLEGAVTEKPAALEMAKSMARTFGSG